jgi:hypothetical protein
MATHHQIREPVPGPPTQPARPPLTKGGADDDQCPKQKEIGFQLLNRFLLGPSSSNVDSQVGGWKGYGPMCSASSHRLRASRNINES